MENTTYEIVKDVFTLIFTYAAVVIAGEGLTTWKKQIKGGKEFEVGFNWYHAVLEVRQAIKIVRNPAVWLGETDKAKADYKEKHSEATEEEVEKQANAHVYVLRWEKISKAYTEVEANLLGAEILWGKEVLIRTRPLRNCVTTLNIKLMQHFRPEYKISDEDTSNFVYSQGNDDNPDEFSTKVDDAVDAVANFLKSKGILV